MAVENLEVKISGTNNAKPVQDALKSIEGALEQVSSTSKKSQKTLSDLANANIASGNVKASLETIERALRKLGVSAADSKAAVRSFAQSNGLATPSLNNLAKSSNLTTKAINSFARANSAAVPKLKAFDAAAQKNAITLQGLRNSIRRTKTGLLGFIATFAAIKGITATKDLILLADSFQTLEKRVASLAANSGDVPNRFELIKETANEAGVEVTTLVEIYNRASLAAEQLKLSSGDLTVLLESIAKGAVASGASSFNMRAGLIQLSQALSAGTVRAEEFNSILENIPFIANVVAKQLGVTTGELRKQVLAGELSSQKFSRALIKGKDDIERAFKPLARTLPAQINRLKNTFAEFFTELAQRSDLIETVATAIDTLIASIKNGDLDIDALAKEINNTIKAITEGIPKALQLLSKAADLTAALFRQIGNVVSAFELVGDVLDFWISPISLIVDIIAVMEREEIAAVALSNRLDDLQTKIDKLNETKLEIISDDDIARISSNVTRIEFELKRLKEAAGGRNKTKPDADTTSRIKELEGLLAQLKGEKLDLQSKQESAENEEISRLANILKLQTLITSQLPVQTAETKALTRELRIKESLIKKGQQGGRNKKVGAATKRRDEITKELEALYASALEEIDKSAFAAEGVELRLKFEADLKIDELVAQFDKLNSKVKETTELGKKAFKFQGRELNLDDARQELDSIQSKLKETFSSRNLRGFTIAEVEGQLDTLNERLKNIPTGTVIIKTEQLEAAITLKNELIKDDAVFPGINTQKIEDQATVIQNLQDHIDALTRSKIKLTAANVLQIEAVQKQRIGLQSILRANEKQDRELKKIADRRFVREQTILEELGKSNTDNLKKQLKKYRDSLKEETRSLKAELKKRENSIKSFQDKIEALEDRISDRKLKRTQAKDETKQIKGGIQQSRELSVRALSAFTRGDVEIAEELALKQREIAEGVAEIATKRREDAQVALDSADTDKERSDAQSRLANAVRQENQVKKQLVSADTNLELIQPKLLKSYKAQLKAEEKNRDVLQEKLDKAKEFEETIKSIADILNGQTIEAKFELNTDGFSDKIKQVVEQLNAVQEGIAKIEGKEFTPIEVPKFTSTPKTSKVDFQRGTDTIGKDANQKTISKFSAQGQPTGDKNKFRTVSDSERQTFRNTYKNEMVDGVKTFTQTSRTPQRSALNNASQTLKSGREFNQTQREGAEQKEYAFAMTPDSVASLSQAVGTAVAEKTSETEQTVNLEGSVTVDVNVNGKPDSTHDVKLQKSSQGSKNTKNNTPLTEA